MTQQEFQERYAIMTGFRWSQLEKHLQAVPCNCGKQACPGWQMITLPTALPPLRVTAPSGPQQQPRTREHHALVGR
jgi:hypothetical protein